mgnify:CR=1 FL=1
MEDVDNTSSNIAVKPLYFEMKIHYEPRMEDLAVIRDDRFWKGGSRASIIDYDDYDDDDGDDGDDDDEYTNLYLCFLLFLYIYSTS